MGNLLEFNKFINDIDKIHKKIHKEIENHSIYSIKNNPNILDKVDRMNKIYTFLNLDKTELDTLLSNTAINVSNEIKDLLNELEIGYFEVKPTNREVNIYYKKDLIGRFNIYNGNINMLPTELKVTKNTNYISINTKNLKPTYSIDVGSDNKYVIYIDLKNIDNKYTNCNTSLCNVQRILNQYNAKLNNLKYYYADSGFKLKLSKFLYRKEWLDIYRMIRDNQAEELKAYQSMLNRLDDIQEEIDTLIFDYENIRDIELEYPVYFDLMLKQLIQNRIRQKIGLLT